MRKDFTAAPRAYRKLRFAEDSHAAVYLYGATGFGKTRLIKEYLDKKNVIWLSSMDTEWDLSSLDAKPVGRIRYVVVDDLQLMKDAEQKKTLLSLAVRSDVWLVMMGRMQPPLWMVQLITDGHLIIVTEDDLALSLDEVCRIAGNTGLHLDKAVAEDIALSAQGNAYVISSILQLMRTGEELDGNLRRTVNSIFVRHLEMDIIPQWSTNLQEFLMQMSVVDEFTLPLAVMITGDNHAPVLLEEAIGTGNFLLQEGEVYHLRPSLIEALRQRGLKVFGLQKYNHYVNNAGLYFEMQDDFLRAIKLYEISGNKEGIRSLLIRSARRNPGACNYYELRSYYLALEDWEIETSPVLMSAMSMLYSIMMNPEKSECWYEKLKAYGAKQSGGERREADEQLLYLDIGLPHRGTLDLIELLKHTASLMRSGGIALPELSLTGNQPSTMNGGKDFCTWSKRDQLLADTIGKMVEKVVGSMGRGLIHAALCESFYEKGGRDEEVLHHAIMLQMEIDSGGKTELLFASVGIQVRLNLLSGSVTNAVKLIDSFEERLAREKNDSLRPNLDALRCRAALVMGDFNQVHAWLEQAPNEQVEFWTLNRYQYLTKVRCYLALGQNSDAVNLLKRMLYYADVSKRTYIRMESRLLLAIALRREKREWKNTLLEALEEIQEYAFVRIISEKGAGIMPLLKEIRKEYLVSQGADRAWFERVFKETAMLSERYPGYLVCDSAQPRDFSQTALSVLRMQAEGLSIKEIAAALGLSERNVKYHATENYRKLGAKGKTDAVQIAKSLHLL